MREFLGVKFFCQLFSQLCDALTLVDLGIKPEANIDLTLAEGLLGGAPTRE